MTKRPPTLEKLVNKLPDLGLGLFSNINKKTVDSIVSKINEGGRESLLALIDMLVEPGRGNDVKPRYALHCLAVRLCRPDEEKSRRVFIQTLAMQLGGNKPKSVQEYLIQQLQVAGDKEVCPALGKMLKDEELYEAAAQAIVAIGDGAAEQLRNALPEVKGKMMLTIIQNLGVIRDAESVDALRKALDDDNRDIRLAACWALANIGDANSADLLLKAADVEGTYERNAATKASLLLAERLFEVGKKELAEKIYMYLRNTRNRPDEAYIRDAANKGLSTMKGMHV